MFIYYLLCIALYFLLTDKVTTFGCCPHHRRNSSLWRGQVLKKHLSLWDLKGGLALLKELENSCKVFYTTYHAWVDVLKGKKATGLKGRETNVRGKRKLWEGPCLWKEKQVPDAEGDTNRVWYLHAEGTPVLLRVSCGRAFLNWPN